MHPLKNQEYTYALWVTNPNVVSLQWTSASQPPLDTRQGMLKARKICRCSMNGYNLLKTLQLNVACGSFILANTEGLHPTSHWSSFRSSHHGSPWISMVSWLHMFPSTMTRCSSDAKRLRKSGQWTASWLRKRVPSGEMFFDFCGGHIWISPRRIVSE